jgi:hypothetical protein
MTDQTLASRYQRARTSLLLVVTGVVMLASFLWYLPGAYHADNMNNYHLYSWREFKFNNIVDMYVNHDLNLYNGPGFITGGTGIEYPALLSMLIRATSGVGVSGGIPGDAYRSGIPPSSSKNQDTCTPIGACQNNPASNSGTNGNVPAYLLLNYVMIFIFGLLAILLMTYWPGAKPWLFAASPILFIYAGYNWDVVAIALTLAAFLMLRHSTGDASRSYNLALEVGGFSLLTVAVWFKIFPIVFLGAALLDRGRRRLWRVALLDSGIFIVLSVLINLPTLIANPQSWSFFFWISQNRPIEPSSVWYLLFAGLNLGDVGRGDTTSAINIISLLIVAAGALMIAIAAWRSPRRDILMPAACLLLLWWFSFNKVYDPNFDIWVLFGLAVLGAPLWLNVGLSLLALIWYITAIGGLALSTYLTPEGQGWYVSHVLIYAILIRLLLLTAIIVWTWRKLMQAEQPTTERTMVVREEPTLLAVN